MLMELQSRNAALCHTTAAAKIYITDKRKHHSLNGVFFYLLRLKFLKKSVSIAEHSSAIIPGTITGLWL